MSVTISIEDLPRLVGQDLGTSEWMLVDQERINRFAEVTEDHQWIHVDTERADREIGGTVAHGFLTLSLLSAMAARSGLKIQGMTRGVNYGFDKIRFTSFVPSGSRVRLRQTLKALEPKAGGWSMTRECSVEIEGQPKPALVAEWISVVYG